MKKVILITTVMLLALSLKAQITLEATYPGEIDKGLLSYTILENHGGKYYLPNCSNNTLQLYNLNHSVFKTISIPAQNGCYAVYAVTNLLFDTDSTTIDYLLWGSDSVSFVPFIKIYNEAGTLLLSDTTYTLGDHSLSSFKQIIPTENGMKLIVYGELNVGKVYSLPGNVPEGFLSVALNDNSLKLSNPFPNPTFNFVTIEYNLPINTDKGELIFYSYNGQEVKRFKVDNTFDHLRISTADLPAGTYYFTMQTAKGISEGKKMVVIK